jgi:streptomycin 6-kinase
VAVAALDPYLQRWDLRLHGPPPEQRYMGATPTGAVAFVRRGGEALVLKLLTADQDEARTAGVLAHWDGRGAVRLVEADAGAVLMERAVPGEDLVAVMDRDGDEAATLIACEVMEKLVRPAPLGGGFRTIGHWGKGFARDREAALAVGFPAELIDHGEQVFFELEASQAEPILLHGDFHHRNILLDAARGWLAMDPKGILGEPAYEPASLLRNPNDRMDYCARAEVIERRSRLMAERLGFDYRRIVAWCFAQWVLSDLWAIEDGMTYRPDWLDGPLAARTLL